MAVDPDRASSPLSAVATFVTLVVLAWGSVAIDSFRYGLGNNALQVPILQHAVDPALFPGDPFIATLDKYTSAVWWVLAQVGRVFEIRDWEPIIFGLHVVSRVLFLAGLHAVIGVYVRDRRMLLALVSVLALGQSLRGASAVGVHGMMGGVADHTAIATAVALFAMAAALRERHVAAAVFAALAFDINAFVGVWLLPVVLVSLYAAGPGRRGSRRVWLGAAASFAALASPVAVWVFSAVAAPTPSHVEPFDYRAFLYDYFPKHFFIDSAETHALAMLGTITLVGVAGVSVLGRAARGLRLAYGCWIALFLIGAVAPYLTSSPAILNLHLLRMDGFLTILAAAAAAVCAAKVVERRATEPDALAAAVCVIAGLATGYWWLTLAGVGVAGTVLDVRSRPGRWLAVATLAVSAASAVVLFDRAWSNGGMVIASALALVATFVATRAPVAAAFALATTFSWTQQPKAVALSFVAIAIGWVPRLDARRRRVVVQSMLIGTALLGLVRTGETAHRLLLGLVMAAVIAEPWLSRTRMTRLLATGASALGYAIPMALAALGTAIELGRPGPRDPLAAEIAAWREVQHWARGNTGLADVFVVPDWPVGFGVWAERSIWVDWKHGAAVMWDPSYYPVYRERRRVQAEATDPAAFARRTGVCFAIANVAHPRWTFPRVDVMSAGLPVAFRNEWFAVVELCRGRVQRTGQVSQATLVTVPNDT